MFSKTRTKASILFYVNSMFGIGHYKRIANIVIALTEHNTKLDITVLYGGVPTDVFDRIPNCKALKLEGFNHWGEEVKNELKPSITDININEVFAKRKNLIQQIVDNNTFDILVIEYFPFSRHLLLDEIVNIICSVKKRCPQCVIVSSVRDIIHELPDSSYILIEDIINTYFNYILVHADPHVILFNESYGSTSKFDDKIVYTGFIVPKSQSLIQRFDRFNKSSIVVSAGGGRDGYPLIKSFLSSLQNSCDFFENMNIIIFLGPFFPEINLKEILNTIKIYNTKNVCLKIEKAPLYESVLNKAFLSISMSGYNTCYELLAHGIPMLLWPRIRREQLIRAQLFEKLGVAKIVTNAEQIINELKRFLNNNHFLEQKCQVDLNGANNTADFIMKLVF